MDANGLKNAIGTYWGQKCYAVGTEIGITSGGSLRADLLAVNMRGDFVLVEIKSSYADFRSDKKWWHYVDYCNRLYFGITDVLYEKVHDLIPKGIGIIVIDSQTGEPRVRQPATRREMDKTIHQNLLIRMLFRHSEFSRYRRTKRR